MSEKKNDQNTRKNSNKTPLNWLLNSGTAARRLAGDLARCRFQYFPLGA
jgi:hypothetical protein